MAIPNLDKAQVDKSLFKDSAANRQGLAKLLIYEYYELNPPYYLPGYVNNIIRVMINKWLQEVVQHS